MIFSSIKSRVILLAIIPVAAASIIFFSYFVSKQNNDIESALTGKGNDIASYLASASEYEIFSGNLSRLTPLVDSFFQEKGVISITITDEIGTLLIQRPVIKSPAQEAETNTPKNRVFSKPVLQSTISINDFDEPEENLPSVIGWVVIEISNDMVTERKWEATFETLIIMLAILIISIYLGTIISRRITSPIISLTNSIKEIEHGNLNIPIKTNATGELLSLEHGIRGMLRSLKTSHIDAQQKIEHATVELRESLELLEHKNYDLTIAQQTALSASQAKSSFLANISHEIRTPMNGILGFVRLLNNTQLSDAQADYLQTIEQSSHNLLRIINDVLDLSKVEAGKLVIKNMSFNLRECIEDVEILVSPSTHEKELEIAVLFYNDTPEYITGPQDRVRQILINLIGNAIKFSDEGIIIIRVMLEKQTNDTAIIKITVTDQGPGITERSQRILFDSFTQLDESDTRQHGGAGLGLSISKALAKAMNGDIGVESQITEGSTFWFTFECAIPKSDATLPNESKPFKEKIIKLYDSNELSRLCVSHAFRNLGFSVQEFATLESLNDQTEGGKQADIIAYNLTIDETKDIDTTFYMHQLCQTDNSLAIINMPNQDIFSGLRKHGINHYLSRPFRVTDLVTVLTKMTSSNKTYGSSEVHTRKRGRQQYSQQRLDGITILVAEDNPINAKFISIILERSGAKTVVVNNGKLALNEFSKNKFDAILMDIHMPIMDGVVATRKIRELERPGHRIPIIGLTAINIHQKISRFTHAGLDEVLEKPIAVDELLEKIISRIHANKDNANITAPLNSQNKRKKQSRPLDLDTKLSSTMNEMLIVELPKTKKILREAYNKEDWKLLRNEMHRFIGGLSYCNVPELQQLAIAFQVSLKSNSDDHDVKFDAMIKEIDALLVS